MPSTILHVALLLFAGSASASEEAYIKRLSETTEQQYREDMRLMNIPMHETRHHMYRARVRMSSAEKRIGRLCARLEKAGATDLSSSTMRGGQSTGAPSFGPVVFRAPRASEKNIQAIVEAEIDMIGYNVNTSSYDERLDQLLTRRDAFRKEVLSSRAKLEQSPLLSRLVGYHLGLLEKAGARAQAARESSRFMIFYEVRGD